MDMSSIVNSLSATTNTPAAFASPPLRSNVKPPFAQAPVRALPSLAVAIGAFAASPQCTQMKKRKSSSRVARSILHAASKNRKSRVVFDFTEEEMAKYFHLPQRVAAKRLGVAVITIKRNCKRRGIKWPYRAEKLREIQDAKSSKSVHRVHRRHGDSKHVLEAMTPMRMLSEAARAFSRLPIECMSETR